MSDAPTELGNGMVVGTYRLVERIGEGGMGAVYRAQNIHVASIVRAVKVIRAAFAAEPDFRHRFLQEAELMEILRHDHILRVETVGEAQGSLYMVMDLLVGQTLDEAIHQTPGGLPLGLGVGMMCQALEGIAHAHSHGIIHRDLKPANLFLTQDGVIKVLDFGIARHGSGTRKLTHTGQGMPGTPAYYAPEFVDGLGASPASDLYSLGVSFFELLAGRPPFLPGGGSDAQAAMSLMMQHATKPCPDLREFRPEVPEALAAVVLKACAKTPAARFTDAAVFREALLAALPEAQAFVERAPYVVSTPTMRSGTPYQSEAPVRAIAAQPLAETWTPPAEGLGLGQRTAQSDEDHRGTQPLQQNGRLPSSIGTAPMGLPGLVPAERRTARSEGSTRVDAPVAPPRRWPWAVGLGAVGLLGLAWAARPGPTPLPVPPLGVDAGHAQALAPVPVPLPVPVLPPVPGTMVELPGGTLHQGRAASRAAAALDVPVHDVAVAPVALERFEVTIMDYVEFAQKTGVASAWAAIKDLRMIGRLAVTSVSQADAERYCAWRYPGGRLPTESEWEWAARGPGQALYPWGDAFKAECVVSGLGPAARVQLGGSRPCGDTASGLHDLSGNVWEWTGTRASLYGPGPAPEAGAFVVRGGSYQSQDPAELTATSRQFRAAPSPSIGFRCAVGRTP